MCSAFTPDCGYDNSTIILIRAGWPLKAFKNRDLIMQYE